MHMSKLAIGTALALIIAVAIGRAEGATSAFEGTLSSTGISVEMDTNGDGLQGGVLTGIMDGPAVTGGSQFDFQSYIEFSPPRLSANCPVGTGELPLLLNRFVLYQRSTGDQIVGQINSTTTCVDPDTGAFTTDGSATITGGTGQFAGATGSFELNQTGAVLVHSGNRVFIRLSGPFKGTITTTP